MFRCIHNHKDILLLYNCNQHSNYISFILLSPLIIGVCCLCYCTQGQNHITAMSRAIYFIVVGVIALCIDAALRHIDTFNPLRVYEFDVNSRVVLTFVRDGLLSEF